MRRGAGEGAELRKLRSVLVIVALLSLGLALVVPAEDLLETAYDESEALPYAGLPLFSLTVPQASALATAELRCGSMFRLNALPRGSQRSLARECGLYLHPNSLAILNHSLRC